MISADVRQGVVIYSTDRAAIHHNITNDIAFFRKYVPSLLAACGECAGAFWFHTTAWTAGCGDGIACLRLSGSAEIARRAAAGGRTGLDEHQKGTEAVDGKLQRLVFWMPLSV